jgi:hypothetical protein
MAEISDFEKIEDSEFERLFKYCGIIQANIDKAKKEGVHSTLMVMEANCPPGHAGLQEANGLRQSIQRIHGRGRGGRVPTPRHPLLGRPPLSSETSEPKRGPTLVTAVEEQQGSWPSKWITKLGSKWADEVMIRGDRVQQKQGALTTVLATVAAPSAVEKGPWKCQIAECQQPRHQLRSCHALQGLSEEERKSK